VNEVVEILSREDLVAARDYHFQRLQDIFAGITLSAPFFLQGINGRAEADPYGEPEEWVAQCLKDLAHRAERILDRRVFRPLVVEFNPYGVHFIDRMFGARVYHYEGQWWSDGLDIPVGALQPPDLENNETWQLAQRAALAFLSYDVSVPLFGLPTIASALNIGLNLHGERLLVAMLTDPDAAHHDLAVINDVLIALHKWYLAHIPLRQLQPIVAAGRCQPPGYGQLCGCSTHLVSAETNAEFVAPLDAALLGAYPHGGMIHLCGAHAQHIPVWREMRELQAVQVNDRAADDLPIYLRELRDDQVVYLNPTATSTVDEALRLTGGRRIVLVAEPPRKETEAAAGVSA
jgi:hypothetical protein